MKAKAWRQLGEAVSRLAEWLHEISIRCLSRSWNR